MDRIIPEIMSASTHSCRGIRITVGIDNLKTSYVGVGGLKNDLNGSCIALIKYYNGNR